MFGYSISALGDVNNDGFDDFVVGKDSADPGQNHSYVFNGGLGGITDPDAAGNTVPNGTDPSNFSNSIVAGIGALSREFDRGSDAAAGEAARRRRLYTSFLTINKLLERRPVRGRMRRRNAGRGP